MAVDYTKVFTILGVYADKIRDYYAYIATLNTDKDAIDTILAAQDVVYLEDGLDDLYGEFKQSISDWEGGLINRMEEVLTDEDLIGANFNFGSRPGVNEALLALIKDMSANDKNVTASVATVGSVAYDAANTLYGKVVTGTTLDGFSPPMEGAPVVLEYYGATTQLTPDSETIQLTCISDSEQGATRGSEQFSVKGSSAASGPYSTTGESIGTLATMTVADNDVASFVSNAHFSSWADDELTGWTTIDGTPATHFAEETTAILYEDAGSSLKIIGGTGGEVVELVQTLTPSSFNRYQAYWLSVWARKHIDTLSDATIIITIYDDNFSFPLSVTPTTTAWTNYSAQIRIPAIVVGDLKLKIKTDSGGLDSDTHNAVVLDQLVMTPCRYMAGVSVVVFGGPEQWLIGDTAIFTVSNNSAGKFQSVFRKAFRVQLPTDATPTISDSLVA